MRKIIEVTETNIKDGLVLFTAAGKAEDGPVKAAGRMIADSDGHAFVYLLDGGADYIYLKFPLPTWPSINQSLKNGTDPMLVWGEAQLELEAFNEELSMLLENIEDNDNYALPFRQEVEEIFHEALASRA